MFFTEKNGTLKMMDMIQQRINIFLQAGMIESSEVQVLNQWIAVIDEYSKDYDKEKMERLITHSAMMMKRQRENAVVDSMPEFIFESVKEEAHYEDCVRLYEKMNAIFPVSENEKKYLILHLCGLYGSES